MKLDVKKTALLFGTFAGVMHTVWSLMVAFGFAQAYLNWMIGLHFLNNPFRVAAFSLTGAVMLVVATAVIGYLVGWVFATVWNKIQSK